MQHNTIMKAIAVVAGLCLCFFVLDRAIDFNEMFEKGKQYVQSGKELYEKGKETYNDVKAVAEQVVDVIKPAAKAIMELQQPAILNNPYRDKVASVRKGDALCPGEREYLAKRKPKVKIALEKLLGRSLDGKRVPTIAFIGSGGGYRAMLCTTGFLFGAEKIGLLPAITYISALSGSTWAVGSWISSGMAIAQFRTYIAQCAAKPFENISAAEMKLISDMLAVKMVYDQPLTLVDMYGALLANRLLAFSGDKCQMTYLSQQANRVQSGDWPYPIYTAVDGREAVSINPPWYEYTPHEIGSSDFEIYIPSWAFGRTFKAGKSTNTVPEQPLGYHFGTWGSAFAAHVGIIWQELTKNIPDPIIKPILFKKFVEPMQGKRPVPFWAEIPNYMFGMSGEELGSRELLKLVDAGLEFNLPYPPLSGMRPERKADILIFLDSSAGNIPGQLERVEDYATEHELPFPTIDYANLKTSTITVFKDKDNKNAPVVIYMPRISNKALWEKNKGRPEFSGFNLANFDLSFCANDGFCVTKNFQYAAEQSKQVMEQTEFNMVTSKELLVEAINWVIDNRP